MALDLSFLDNLGQGQNDDDEDQAQDPSNLNIVQQPLPVALTDTPDEDAAPQVQQPPAGNMVMAAPGGPSALNTVIPSSDDDETKDFTIQDPNVKAYIQSIYGDKYSDAARQALVDKQKEDSSGPNWTAALASLGAGLQGKDASAAGMSFLNAQQSARDEQLKNFDEGRKGLLENQKSGSALRQSAKEAAISDEESDPDSDQSKLAQQAALKMGVDPKVAATITAEQFKAQGPLFEKMYQVEQNRLARKDTANARADAAKDRADQRNTASQDKALLTTQTILESARGNPAAAQAEKDIYSAQKANTLATMYGDPNKLSMPQVRLLASEIGKIASGGAPGVSELEGITPNTLTGKLSDITTKLTNSPTPANAAAFVKQYQDYANGLTKDAQKVIEDKYGRVIESRKSQLGDANYNNLKANYIDRFKAQNDNAAAVASDNTPVKVIDPKGIPRMVPKSQLKDALLAGGTLAPNAGVAQNAGGQ